MRDLVDVGFKNAADDMNVLVMGGRVISQAVALELVDAFLDAKYAGKERHQRRLNKVQAIEERYVAQGGIMASEPPEIHVAGRGKDGRRGRDASG